MIGVTMWEVADYSITNENVLKHVEIPSMEDIVHYRRLTWMGKNCQNAVIQIPSEIPGCLDGLPYRKLVLTPTRQATTFYAG